MRFFKSIIILSIVILVTLAVYYLVKSNYFPNQKIFSATSNTSISSQPQWQQGSISNIDSIGLPGSIKIDNTSLDYERLDLSSYTFTASPDSGKLNIVDGNLNTGWFTEDDISYIPNGSMDPVTPSVVQGWLIIDFGEEINNIKRFASKNGHPLGLDEHVYYSTDNINYNFVTGMGEGDEFDPDCGCDVDYFVLGNVISARYIKIAIEVTLEALPEMWFIAPAPAGLVLEFYIDTYGGSATHTTAATQIDGQEGSADKTLIEWTSFTPTQTTPANTSITYEFRTSANGSDWTNWSAPQEYSGSPLDLTGLTANRYLQVKATLTTTDAGTTPQIDDYTINFHNNQKPNKPTAQTVVIGD